MTDTQPRLAIVGPGLIGTSVALAAARRWPGLEARTVDQGEPLESIRDSLVVVLAMPVDAIIQVLPRLGAVMHPQALVIDTGSTKRAIMAAAAAARLSQFVGGHPMAGGTGTGPSEARADLFDGRAWFLTNPDAPDAVRRAVKFVEALGARPVVLSDRGEEHDRLMAAVSHLPQLAASALMVTAARAVGDDNLKWAGKGLRDTTRLASSQASVWESVLASNSAEIKPLLHAMAAELMTLSEQLDDREAVRKFFDEAARAKSSCL
ncbi:MAG: prephenate dehydrogenase/arogenate dehydrogenase family protein [Acidobacteriota bacterium]|nr:prephenate dehydrogenase/arogenate dehydrogenase family protein [Acidobacteriota bacterium]